MKKRYMTSEEIQEEDEYYADDKPTRIINDKLEELYQDEGWNS